MISRENKLFWESRLPAENKKACAEQDKKIHYIQ